MITKRIIAATMALALCLSMTACAGKDDLKSSSESKSETTTQGQQSTVAKEAKNEAKEYKSKNGAYTLSVLGEWTVTNTSNDDFLCLDNSDQSLTVMIQRFSKKSNPNMTLQSFIAFYKKNVMSSLGDTVEKDVSLENKAIKGSKYSELSTTQGGETYKGIFYYIETESGFYTYCVTGKQKIYDKSIEELKNAVNSLVENA